MHPHQKVPGNYKWTLICEMNQILPANWLAALAHQKVMFTF